MIEIMKRILGCVALGLVTIVASAQWTNPADDIPAYNAKPPVKPLKPTLTGDQLTGEYFSHPYQVTAYKMAAKIPAVLHQQPCYCHCDRALGHNSLHSCFEGTHGAACSTCMSEAVYAYEQTQKGKTPAQIRAGIERGEWQSVDLQAAKM
jgi:Protein of unknown function with PCYCGC motif